MSISFSKAEARRYLLRYHGLMPARSLVEQVGVRTVMSRLRCIQVDPLDVVGRNAQLVMQSRVRGFRPGLLDELVYESNELVEAWDKVRSIVVCEDWENLRPFRRRMREAHERSGNPSAEVLDYVRDELAKRGRLTSLDLEDRGRAEWRWAPARSVRAALEIMFDWGEIGIAGRIANRKVYAPIADIVDSSREPGQALDHEAYLRWHVERRVAATGLIADRSGPAWLGIEGAGANERRVALDSCEQAGSIVRVAVEGVRARCFVPANANESPADGPAPAGSAPTSAAFIAPLDNLLWDRRLIVELFDFEYTWEVYKPASTRVYGYYVLPVLLGDRFVARWEPRRSGRRLVVHGWWWEDAARPMRNDPVATAAVGEALAAFMQFLEVADIEFESGVATRDRAFLRRAIAVSPRKASAGVATTPPAR